MNGNINVDHRMGAGPYIGGITDIYPQLRHDNRPLFASLLITLLRSWGGIEPLTQGFLLSWAQGSLVRQLSTCTHRGQHVQSGQGIPRGCTGWYIPGCGIPAYTRRCIPSIYRPGYPTCVHPWVSHLCTPLGIPPMYTLGIEHPMYTLGMEHPMVHPGYTLPC